MMQHFKKDRWFKINSRTVNGSNPDWKSPKSRRYLESGVSLEFSRDQFNGWCEDHRGEILSIFESGEIPSVDRIDPNLGYSLENLQIITHRENSKRGAETAGKNRKRAVIGTSLFTEEMLRCDSAMDAEQYGFEHSLIAQCVNGKRRSHGGYSWSYL